MAAAPSPGEGSNVAPVNVLTPSPEHATTPERSHRSPQYRSWNWTFHQSHSQLTVLFFVPHDTPPDNIVVDIGEQHLVAHVIGDQHPIVKGRLYRQVRREHCSWTLERSRGESRRRSRRNSHHEQPPSGYAAAHTQSQGSGGRLPELGASRAASPSSSAASSYEMLFSDSGLNSPASRSPRPPGSEPSGRASPRGMSDSLTLSEGSGSDAQYTSSGPGSSGGEADNGVRSAHSSASSGDVSQGSSGPALSGHSMTAQAAPRLVTVHLEKITGCIWPCLISGPIRRAHASDDESDEEEEAAQVRLSAALSEALSDLRAGGAAGENDGESPLSTDESGPNTQSGAAVDSAASDAGSDTVLGARSQRKARPRRSSVDDIDATSLVILGHFAAAKGSRPQTPGGVDDAFGYFSRAWRISEMPIATRKLVLDFLPLMPHLDFPTADGSGQSQAPQMAQQGSCDTLQPGVRGAANATVCSPSRRKRLIAALGGQTSLARLYVSYGRLHLSSAQALKSPLAFPSGPLTTPFSTSRGATPGEQSSPSSSRASSTASSTRAHRPGGASPPALVPPSEVALQPSAPRYGPLEYFKEALRLEPHVYIDPADWAEASELATEEALEASFRAQLELAAERAADDSIEHEEQDGYSGPTSPRSVTSGELSPSSQSGRKRRRRRKDSSRRGATSSRRKRASPDETVITFVSATALLSFALAGGVAAMSWWRRTSALTQ